MKKLKIAKWDKWQSYRRDRGQPPWIKVHRELMRKVEWVGMTDAQRGQLVAIWLLAADRDGVIPASPEIIQKLCYMDSEPDILFFIEQGFIDDDASLTSAWRQSDETETETETETDIGQPRTPDRFNDFWQAYPKKVKKAEAKKKWKSKKLDRIADQIISDIQERGKKDRRWLEGFVPDPTTYINGERWDDEIDSSRSGQPAEPTRPESRILNP